MRKLIILFTLFVTILAVPVLAMDGVEMKISGDYNNFSWNYPAISENVAIFKSSSGMIFMYDTNKKIFKQLSSEAAQYQISIYANKVVYENSGIKLSDINTQETRQISTSGSRPSIYGDKIAYIKNWNVFLYNLLDNSELQLTTKNGSIYDRIGDSTGTAMFDGHVIWREYVLESGGYRMVLYSTSLSQSRVLNILPDDLVNTNYIGVYENYIVWSTNSSVYLYALNDANPSQESYGMVSDPNTNEGIWLANINRDKIVWDSGGNPWINIYDIKTGVRSKVNIANSDSYNPVTDGDKILYPCGYYIGYCMTDITLPSEEVYSLNSTGNSVTVINPYKNAVVSTIATGTNPSDVGLSPDEMKLYVLNSGSKNVTVVQTYGPTGDFQVVDTKNVNPTSNQIITAVAGDNDSNVYVALKPKSGTGAGIVRKISSSGATDLSVGVNPNSLKISPDNKTLFISNADSSKVSSIALDTFTLNSDIATGGGPKLVKP